MNNYQEIENQLREFLFRATVCLIKAAKFTRSLGYDASAEKYPLLILMADVMNAGDTTDGIEEALDGLEELLISAGRIKDFTGHQMDEMLNTFDDFRNAVDNWTQKNNFSQKPQKIKNLLIHFLSATRHSVLGSNRSTPDENMLRWENLCVACYRALRIVVDQRMPANVPEENVHDRKSTTSVALEYVLRNLPEDAFLLEVRDGLIKEEIADAMRFARINEKKIVNSQLKPKAQAKLLNYYWRIAFPYFTGNEYQWNPIIKRKLISGKAVSGESSLLAVPNESEPVGSTLISFSAENRETDKTPVPQKSGVPDRRKELPELGGDIYWRDREIEKEEGAAETEFDYAPDVPQIKGSPKGSAAWSKAFQPVGLKPIWAKGGLTLEMLGVVLRRLQADADKNPQNAPARLVLAFIQLLIFYGFAPGTLDNMKRVSSLNEIDIDEKSSLFLLNERIYIRPRRENGAAAYGTFPYTDERKTKHLPSQKLYSLSIIPFVLENLKFSPEAGNELSKSETFGWLQNGEPKRLSPKTVDDHLKKKLVDTRKRSRREGVEFPDTIEVGKIAEAILSFRNLELEGNELMTAFLSGDVPRHLASQAHYTNYSQELLETEVRTIQQSTGEALTRESQNLIHCLGMAELSFNFKFDKNISLSAPGNNVGSPFIARENALRDFFGTLEEQAKNSPNWRHRFNCLMAMTAAKLMLLNGIRSVEAKKLNADRLYLRADENSQIAIEAKFNQRFKEWRVIKLSPEMRDELSVYTEARDKILKRLIERQAKSEGDLEKARGNAFFFFVRRYDLPLALTAENLREFLENKDYFPEKFFGKINFGRHLWRTTAALSGIRSEIIDRQTGHTTQGREPLGVYSLHDWVKSTEITRRIEKDLRAIL